MPIEKIIPEGGATPRGHYTPGMRAGDFIYVSGQGPIDPVSDQLVNTDVEAPQGESHRDCRGAAGTGGQVAQRAAWRRTGRAEG